MPPPRIPNLGTPMPAPFAQHVTQQNPIPDGPLRRAPERNRGTVTAQPQMAEELQKLRSLLASLIAMGEAAKDLRGDQRQDAIDAAGDFVYENLPEELFDTLESDEWFETLSALDTSVVPHKEWLTEVRDNVIEILDLVDEQQTAQQLQETAGSPAVAPQQGADDPRNPDAGKSPQGIANTVSRYDDGDEGN